MIFTTSCRESGIAVNYLDAKRNLEDVSRVGRGILDGSLSEIAAHINTPGPGVPVVVFNSMSWPRNEVVEADVQLPSAAPAVQVVDGAGKPVASQTACDLQNHASGKALTKSQRGGLGYRNILRSRGAKQAAIPPK